MVVDGIHDTQCANDSHWFVMREIPNRYLHDFGNPKSGVNETRGEQLAPVDGI